MIYERGGCRKGLISWDSRHDDGVKSPRWRSGTVLLSTSLLTIAMLIVHGNTRAQLPSIQQAPVSGKTISTPRHLEAFTGKITTVKPKHKILTLESVEGSATEIFSCRKGPAIRTAYGKRKKFQDLKPGMTLVVYYNSRKGRRTVKDVLILKEAPSKLSEESSPPKS